MDIRLALMCGTDIPIPECQLTAHQPRIKEIALIGEKEFLTGVQSLCINKNMLLDEDESVLQNTNNFQIFMTIMSEKETMEKKKYVEQVLLLFFPEYQVMFTPRTIYLNGGPQPAMIDENNFQFLQDSISAICCLKNGAQGKEGFNPADARAKEIAQKIMKGRAKVAALKGEDDVSIFSQYLSVLTVGLGISLQEISDLTMYQLYDLVERYTLYINWDIDIRSRLAGGKPDGKPENWMKNIH